MNGSLETSSRCEMREKNDAEAERVDKSLEEVDDLSTFTRLCAWHLDGMIGTFEVDRDEI